GSLQSRHVETPCSTYSTLPPLRSTDPNPLRKTSARKSPQTQQRASDIHGEEGPARRPDEAGGREAAAQGGSWPGTRQGDRGVPRVRLLYVRAAGLRTSGAASAAAARGCACDKYSCFCRERSSSGAEIQRLLAWYICCLLEAFVAM
uniref:Uncharacterized protein n=1 Tax=Triticum urartu TaxID=4572 RepID=A0A8R7TIU3_TRIUA